MNRIRLPGIASDAILLSSGAVCVISSDETLDETVHCFDSSGRVLWHVSLAGLVKYSSVIGLGRFLRAGGGAAPWLCSSLTGTIREIGPDAQRTVSIAALLAPGEALANFLLLPEGFIASTCQSTLGVLIEPRVMRLDEEGEPLWVTSLPMVDGEGAPDAAPWSIYFVRESLIVSGTSLLAGYSSIRSGIGRWYCLDVLSGEIRWKTERQPIHYAATVGPDRFLIGAQGYGAFDTYLYDGVRGIESHWPTHGYWVTRENGEVRLVEMENVLPSRMHVSVLEPGGGVRRGPHLDGYDTTYPFITSAGDLVFARDGELCVVDGTLKKHVLLSDPALSKPFAGRMLQEPGGKLVFTAGDELWLVNAGIAQMAKSTWPCGSGNVGGNPVWLA